MAIGSLRFRIHPGEPTGPMTRYSIEIDGTEFVSSSVLAEDFRYILDHCDEMAVPGKRLDILFSGASPFSVAVVNRDGSLFLRISDNFDGGVLDEPVEPLVLRAALAAFIEGFLDRPGQDPEWVAGLRGPLARFRDWPGPAVRG